MEPLRVQRRGRPKGATTAILSSSRTQTLGLHHFAFLRAWLQGLDLKWAWDRYVAFSESHSDLRHIEFRRKDMLATLLRLGHQINLTLPPALQITTWLNTLSREPVIAPASVLPSLDEFIQLQGLDPDLYSESELLEIYEEHFATAASDEPEAGSSSHVKALNHLAGILATPPSPTDPLSSWFDERLAKKLMVGGAVNFDQLLDFINVHGYNWFRRIPYLGEVRAQRITAWLIAMESHWGKSLREDALSPPQRTRVSQRMALKDWEEPKRFGMVPLDQLLVPSPLRGNQGLFRTGMPNTLGASDDAQAIAHWLKKYEEREHTRRSYRKEVERFYLWCLHEKKKPLSSIDALDCQDYRGFLARIPPSWISARGAQPGDTGWRPFRKQLEPSSQKLALVIIQTLFEGLRDAGYLVANPMSAVMKGFNLPSPRINPDRSFSIREWDYLMRQAHQEPASPARDRLVLVLELLVGMGLRADELAKAKRSDLRRVSVPDEPDAWILVVTGKRRKQREVPVPDHVVALLASHHQHDLPDSPLPSQALIRAFQGVSQWRMGHDTPTLERPTSEGGLGRSGLYAMLKRFFRRAAAHCTDPLIDPDHLRNGSTHWLRHTFGRQAAADEVPLEVIQQALGHTSLATTTIYTSTERERMIRALRRRSGVNPRRQTN